MGDSDGIFFPVHVPYMKTLLIYRYSANYILRVYPFALLRVNSIHGGYALYSAKCVFKAEGVSINFMYALSLI